MRNLRYIFRSAVQKTLTMRVLAFLVIMLLVNWNYNEPMRRFSADMNYPCVPWVFPFMLAQFTYLVMFFFGVIYVNADIPFMQHSNMYCMIRAGRKKWGCVQLCVLFLRSFALVILTFLCSVITLAPRIEISWDWGSLVKTIAMGQAKVNYDFDYTIYYEAVGKFTPLQLLGLTILITTLVVTLLAIFMFLVSLYVDRVFAVAGTGAAVILMFFVLNMHHTVRYRLAKFVPTIWPQVARIETPEYGFYWLPAVRYMLVFLGIALALFSILVIKRIQRVEFNWDNEDE